MTTYTTSLDGITPDHLHGFFEGWPKPPSTVTHLRILRGSYKIVLAIDSESGNVIGFVNAIGDGVLSAYIPLLEVLPSYRGNGIGQELVRRMIGELDGLYMIDLTTDQGLVPFYEKLGMTAAQAMMIRNFDRQSG